MNNICFFKRLVLSLTCIVLCTGICITANGESTEKWENEYKAYGRNIKVSVNITVPEKDKIPFLAVEPMDELSSEEENKYQEFINTLDNNLEHELYFKANRTVMYYSDHKHHPDLSDTDKVTTPYSTLLEYDRDTAYAENNNLTIHEAENIVNKSIQAILPSVSFQIKDIIVNNRTEYRKTGKKLTDKGYYEIYCLQEIDEIPVAGSIHDAYKHDRTKYDRIISGYGTAYVLATDQNNFEGNYTLWHKTTELATPDQLLSFNTIKPKIEEMIMNGNIRNIYHVYLGYAQYDLPEDSKYSYVLIPAWIVWADFMDTPADEPEKDTENGTGAYMEWDYYKPIIVNAVTGEASNPLDESENRMLLPASLMNWVEGY